MSLSRKAADAVRHAVISGAILMSLIMATGWLLYLQLLAPGFLIDMEMLYGIKRSWVVGGFSLSMLSALWYFLRCLNIVKREI